MTLPKVYVTRRIQDSGMNLLDIRARRWAPAALAACGDARLARMLGAPAPSHAPAGPLHAYYAQRYGFAPACQVVNFSGDNPCSLAGLRLKNRWGGWSGEPFTKISDLHVSVYGR